jgi:NAD(P)-dependent dehydrogenase (short-subunit alcohol dehydrogenase family)
VTVTARSGEQLAETVALITAAGGRATAVAADVTDPRAVEQVVTETEQAFGPVDILVNNAGVVGPIGPLWEVAPEEWWRAVGTHVYGMVLYTHALLPGMVARHRGRIITVASGSSGKFPYASSYGCAKAAQVYLTETLAAETQEHNVYVFAIYPGLVRTAMTEGFRQSAAAQQWLPQYQARYAVEESYVSPAQAAQLVTFLASGQGDGLSGCYLSVADDVAELAKRAEDIQRQNLYVLRLQK